MHPFVQELRQCDVLRLNLSYTQQAPPPLVSGPMSRQVCVPADRLRFTLNTVRHLGQKQPFDFDVPFEGAETGEVLSEDRPVVRWTSNQSIDRFFDVIGVSVHIQRVTGTVHTAVKNGSNPRTPGRGCNNEEKSVGVFLEPGPGVNELRIQGAVVTLGEHLHLWDVEIVLSDVAVLGSGARDFGLSVVIHHRKDECGVNGIVPGGLAHFSAGVKAPGGSTPAFGWTVSGSGASIEGPNTAPWVDVRLGTSPGPVDVAVVVAAQGVSTSSSLRFFPDTPETVRAKELRCLVTSLLKINLFVDPLWDPPRDLTVRPYSRDELVQMNRFASSLLDATSQLLALSDNRAP
jgi:hypothetical protein